MKNFGKLIAISLALLCLTIDANAQDAGDLAATALDLSRTYPGGSARMQGIGGAQTALGGDISSASSNPAGLGFFNRSEFSFSPTFNFVNSTSDYIQTTTKDSKLNFNFANLGVVVNKSKGEFTDGKWRGGSFGITVNRVADFQNRITYEGQNSYDVVNGEIVFDEDRPADLIDRAYYDTYFTDNGHVDFASDIAELAFYTYIIDTFSIDPETVIIDRNLYHPNGDVAIPTPASPSVQQESINSKGAMYQTSLAYGGNYADRIYFGASLGILSVNREVERIYEETIPGTDLSSLILTDTYEISGMGVNAAFGVIARPIDQFLVGLSYTTPSYIGLEQSRELVMEVNFVDESFEDGFVYEPFTYNVTTPSRLSGGVTWFFGKNGFITGDVEKVNYGGAKISNAGAGYSVAGDNQSLGRLESVLNYRLGAEYRFDKFRVRGGYSFMGDATDDDIDNGEGRFSFGGGVRTKDYYIDLGIVSSLGRESLVSPYAGAPLAEVSNTNTTATFSVGFFF